MSENGDLRGGIDLGGTKIEAIIVDGDNHVLGQSREPTPIDGGPADVAKQMADAMNGAAKAAGVEPRRCTGSAWARPATSTTRPAPWPTPATSPTGSSRSSCRRPV